MGDQFDFSLLIGSQYDGGPMEWDEQTLYVSTGTILNHVDINKVKTDPSNDDFNHHFKLNYDLKLQVKAYL